MNLNNNVPEAHPGEHDSIAMSLLEFNNAFIDLDSQRAQEDVEAVRAEAQSNALKLGLTGFHHPRNSRVVIEPLRGRLRQPYRLEISRDYDSLISFTDELPVTCDVYIYRVFHSTLTLKKNLHVKVAMRTEAGRPLQFVFPHKVPNVCIAQIGVRTNIRLFFPALVQGAEARADLDEGNLADIYDHGLYPAVCRLAPELATNWSPSYAAAKLRARNLNGTYQMGTHPFPGDSIRRLGAMVKRRLQEAFPWANGCIWMVQIQGVKEAHTHVPNDNFAREYAFNSLLEGLDRGLVTHGQSWVDVGLQIEENEHVLQWRTDAHHLLVKEFSNFTGNEAVNLCRLPSRSYSRDYVAGLVELSGFRATLDRNRQDPSTAYIQAYTTDKSLIAHLEAGRHGLFMRGTDALRKDGDDPMPAYCKRMMQIYQSGIDHTTAARLEGRIPAQDATTEMLDFPEDLLEKTLCRYPAVDWWQWRQIRIMCIAETLALQNSVHPSLRYMREALNLTAALVWLANGLNSRPDDDQYGRDIMMASCLTAAGRNHGIFLIHPPAQGGPGELPVVSQGAIFLRTILFPPNSGVPRFVHGKELNRATWIQLFRQTPEQLRAHALPPEFIPRRRLLQAGRIPTQKRMSCPHNAEIDAALPEFANLRVSPPHVPHDLAQDLPYEEQVQYLGDVAAQDLPVELTRLWKQFLTDILQKCGNLRGAGAQASHCRLSMQERQNITQEALTNTDLSTIFNRVQYRTSTQKEWADAFDHYFSPLDGKVLVQPQNFPNMIYWRNWSELKNLRPAAVGHMRGRIRILFDQLLWVPQKASDRVWVYNRSDRFEIFPRDCTSNAPQVMMNPSSAKPQWNPPRVVPEEDVAEEFGRQPRATGPRPIPYAHLRQEEEEGSSD